MKKLNNIEYFTMAIKCDADAIAAWENTMATRALTSAEMNQYVYDMETLKKHCIMLTSEISKKIGNY